jgi:hypothetical protein
MDIALCIVLHRNAEKSEVKYHHKYHQKQALVTLVLQGWV